MTKQRSSEIQAVKMGIVFRKKSFRNLGPRQKNFRPPKLGARSSPRPRPTLVVYVSTHTIAFTSVATVQSPVFGVIDVRNELSLLIKFSARISVCVLFFKF